MVRKSFHGLEADEYRHPFDRKAFTALEKTPGLSLLLKKVNEYGIDRLLQISARGNNVLVTPYNFPKLHDALEEACRILDIFPQPRLYLTRGTGSIANFAIGVENPFIGINLEAMEWLTFEELLFVFGHQLSRIQGRYLPYQQLVYVMPFLKFVISSATFGLGGMAANGVEVALCNWFIMTNFTADRAGLLACQNFDAAIRAIMKIAVLPGEYLRPEVVHEFCRQAREFNLEEFGRLDQITKIFSFMEIQQPWGVMRASELLKWVDNGAYDYWINAIDHSDPYSTFQQINDGQSYLNPS